jgi:hypothetical protein
MFSSPAGNGVFIGISRGEGIYKLPPTETHENGVTLVGNAAMAAIAAATEVYVVVSTVSALIMDVGNADAAMRGALLTTALLEERAAVLAKVAAIAEAMFNS